MFGRSSKAFASSDVTTHHPATGWMWLQQIQWLLIWMNLSESQTVVLGSLFPWGHPRLKYRPLTTLMPKLNLKRVHASLVSTSKDWKNDWMWGSLKRASCPCAALQKPHSGDKPWIKDFFFAVPRLKRIKTCCRMSSNLVSMLHNHFHTAREYWVLHLSLHEWNLPTCETEYRLQSLTLVLCQVSNSM